MPLKLALTRQASKYSNAALIILSVGLLGCEKPHAAPAEKAPPPATVSGAVKEADIATIKLTPEAEKRIGIETTPVEFRLVSTTRTLMGEVFLPPDRVTIVTAPVSGTLTADSAVLTAGSFVRKGQRLFQITPFLAPERDLRLQLEREVAAAETRTEAARVRFNRAEQLLLEKAGSEKSVQQAREELDLAETDLKTARARLEQFKAKPLASDTAVAIASPRDGMVQKVLASPGQAVNAGAALIETANLSTVWIRVPIFVGDLKEFDKRQTGMIELPDGTRRAARPVAAPPTADPVSETADFYFELANPQVSLRPGQKLNVTLPVKGQREGLVIPWSAVLHDLHGGTWVYEMIAPQQFTRRRVEVARVAGADAVLNRGPSTGVLIVKTGAAELFSTEFGAGK